MTSKPIHLLHVFPTFAVGGSQTRFAQLARAHGARYLHTVIALDKETDMAARLSGDAAIAFRTLDFDKRRVWSNLLLFRRTIAEIAPDILVTYNWGAIEWALANRGWSARRHVHIEDGFGPDEAQIQFRRRVWGRRLALSGRGTTVVVPSKGLERVALNAWKIPPARIRFIPNGIDCDRFFVDVASRQERSAPLVVGTVATLRREKNIQRLISAFCAVAKDRPPGSLRLLIVGDGPEAATFKAFAAATPFAEWIEFAGASSEPQDWLRKMDVFALSSDTEQMPFSVIEAMASGLPLVSTRVGDVPDMLAAENASKIVRVGDDAAYGQALAGLLESAALRQSLGRANQVKARSQFDAGLMVARYAELFG
ncbi:MAG TPA: glycosyltransferase [Rhizomicrobium sp.]|nr:glycosyltransferase [Rhizomicrobium sp.]